MAENSSSRGRRPSQGPARGKGPGRPSSSGRSGSGRPSTGGSGRPGSGSGRPGASSGGYQGRDGGGAGAGTGGYQGRSGKPGSKGPASRGPNTKGPGAKGPKGPKGPAKPRGPKPFAKADRNDRRMPDKVATYGPHRPRRPQNPPVDRLEVHDSEGVRLQKLLANAGVASRRMSEEMIANGRVTVDGKKVTELGVRVDPRHVEITVDGLPIQLDEKLVYYAFNKPEGVVSTMEDQEGRPCISDFLTSSKHANHRVFHVGRLDSETEGLLLLTNDGELTNRLTHPSYQVPKTYIVQVHGPMEKGVGDRMKKGIELEDGFAKVDSFRLVDSVPGHILVEVVLHTGRNRIIRRLFEEVGYPVERLVRTQVGPIRIGDQKQGVVRDLSNTEVSHLLASVGLGG